jgi:RNA 3'-terminal phosphate cyclase (ATP)
MSRRKKVLHSTGCRCGHYDVSPSSNDDIKKFDRPWPRKLQDYPLFIVMRQLACLYCTSFIPKPRHPLSSFQARNPSIMQADRQVKKQKCQESLQISTACIKIDGSKGEGGGQILRNAMAYACILQKELFIDKIRAGRSRPGLQAQHATGLQLAANIGKGTLIRATRDSSEIHYRPPTTIKLDHESTLATQTLTGDTGTAGSICLLLQAALPCALLAQSSSAETSLILKGGTNADMAPQYDYWELVLLPILHRYVGIQKDQIQASVIRRGYYPKGGGEVHVHVKHCTAPLKPLRMTDRGHLQEIYIRSFHAGKLGRQLAQQMASACHSYLNSRLQDRTVVWKQDVVSESSAIGNGLGILVIAKTNTGCILAGSSLCKPKQNASDAGEAAAKELWNALCAGGCVDDWLQDQLILFMALAEGTSEMLTGSLTLHTTTAIMVAEEMTTAVFQVEKLAEDSNNGNHLTKPADYSLSGRVSGKHIIRCSGCGTHQSLD